MARTHIPLLDNYMAFRYNYGIMALEHGNNSRQIDADERGTLHKSEKYALAWDRFLPWCWKYEVWRFWSSHNNQRQGRSIPPVWMLACLEQRKVDSAIDDDGPLMHPTDNVKELSRPVDSDCNTKAQTSGGCLLASFARDDRSLQLFVRARQHSSDPFFLFLSPWERVGSWESSGAAPGVKLVYRWKKWGTPGPQRDGWYSVVVHDPTPWQFVER